MPKPTGDIQFVAFNQPSLLDGEYVIDVKQQVQIDKSDVWRTAPSAQMKFAVSGPRFSLDPTLIQSQFPPPKSIGEYYNILPHVILNRMTLPWERTIDNSPPSETNQPQSWLALLLFDSTGDQGVKVSNITVQDLIDTYTSSATPQGQPEFVKILPRNPNTRAKPGELMLEVGQHPNDRLTVIDVPKQLLIQILPGPNEIRFLSHVRRSATNETDIRSYFATGCQRPEVCLKTRGLSARNQLFISFHSKDASHSFINSRRRLRTIIPCAWSVSLVGRSRRCSATRPLPVGSKPHGVPTRSAAILMIQRRQAVALRV
jgi:hypothetical protein